MMDLHEHLKNRRVETDRYNFITIDSDNSVVTFPLWNLSGQMVGYQQYRPNADKKKKNHPKEGRYYTYLSGEKGNKMIGVWGLESLSYDKKILVICEGLFDACRLHNHEIPCIALLSSSYKHYKNFITCLGRKVYKVEDDHGSSLGPYQKLELPNSIVDLGECTENQIIKIIEGF